MDTATFAVAASPPPELEEDRTGEVLSFIHGLLLAPEKAPEDLATALAELARVFGAAAAGFAVGAGGATTVTRVDGDGQRLPEAPLPWNDRPELRDKASRGLHAITTPGPDGITWLWTAVDVGPDCSCTVWVNSRAERGWSPGESAALALAGQALVRRIACGACEPALSGILERARLQGNLEKTAHFTGRLAHDFGNVLTGILGFCELSLSQLPADSLPRRYVDEVWQSAQKGARWVHKLQLFSRRRPQQFVPASVAQVLAQEQARVQAAWQGSVTVNNQVPADLPSVGLDAESLREILGQLLDNAREAISGQGTVALSAETTELQEADCRQLLGNASAGPHVEITIADTGHGFSAEARRRLFAEPFYSTKPRHRGLGLAVVYGILQTYQGGLRFGLEAEQGAVVQVFLPTSTAPGAPAVADSGCVAQSARVLVVDDDQMIVRFITSVLGNAGYVVKKASSVTEALDVYRKESGHFDLILTDVIMPQEDGFELARQLRRQNPGTRILFMSCQYGTQSWPQSELLRDYDLLLKPFRPDGLLSAVRGALERKPQGPPAQPQANGSPRCG
jgi:signal transduction histidine kinase